jgi:hypothetical protein
MVPLDIQSDGRTLVVEQQNQGKPSQISEKTFIPTTSNYTRFNNEYFNSRKEIRKLLLLDKF